MKNNDYGSASFQVTYQILYSKIKKVMDKQFEVVQTMKENSYGSRTEKTLKSLLNAENLLHCYEELYNSSPENESELQEIEWLFNNGLLRTNKEIAEREEEKERQVKKLKAFNTRIILNSDYALNLKRAICLIFILAPIIPLIIIHKEWGDELKKLTFSDFLYCTSIEKNIMFEYDILYLFSLIFTGIVIFGLSNIYKIIIDKIIANKYEEAGETPPFPVDTVISCVSYALFIGALFKKKRK